LRYSLKSGRVTTVTLEEEVDAIRAYLKLELIRFEDRLRVSIDIDPASLSAQVPPMLVQTLVENGVKHGISRLKEGGEVTVISRVEGDSLRIQVTNSGQIAATGAGATQIGIDNARERLRLIYGATASLVLRNLDARSVFAEVLLPFKRAGA
jgi:LytS/YehU family sensor histidine kinase